MGSGLEGEIFVWWLEKFLSYQEDGAGIFPLLSDLSSMPFPWKTHRPPLYARVHEGKIFTLFWNYGKLIQHPFPTCQEDFLFCLHIPIFGDCIDTPP